MAEEAKKLFSASDVALHASRKDCWVVIHGKVGSRASEEIYFVLFFLIQLFSRRERERSGLVWSDSVGSVGWILGFRCMM